MRLTLLCLLTLLWPSCASGQTTLAWNWAPGQQLDLQMEQAAVSTTMLEGRELPGRSTAALRLAWRVLEVNAQNEATIEQAIAALRLSVEIPGEAAMKFDTADEKSVAQYPEFA